MEWAQYTHGIQGTILFASEIKPGDKIVPLEGQTDLGNNSPKEITKVEPRGTTQIEYCYIVTYENGTKSYMSKKVHRNTLVLIVNSFQSGNGVG